MSEYGSYESNDEQEGNALSNQFQVTPAPTNSQVAPLPTPTGNPAPNWQGFRVGSQDQHGHSERVWTRFMPGAVRQAKQVLSSKIFPYRDMGDLYRHALDRHLKWLQTLAPVPSVTGQVDAILELLREEEFHTDFRTVFDKLGTQISVYVGMGAEGEARSLYNRVKQHIDDMPAGPWRRRYIEELDSRFGHLIRNARPVGFTTFAQDGSDD